MGEFNFDGVSLGVGFGAGVLTTLAVQRAIKIVREANTHEDRRVVKTAAMRTADNGYIRALVQQAQQTHLIGRDVRLSDVLIEPRFIRPQDFAALPTDDDLPPVFDAIPLVHDHPYLHAAYNIPTISIDDLSRGDGTIILVGNSGSGRTTALLTIALWSGGYIEFTAPEDSVTEQLQQTEGELTPQQKAERVRKRVAMAERARNRYREQIGEIEAGDESNNEPINPEEDQSLFRQVAPLYVHLGNMLLSNQEFGRRVDPAEPFVRALQATPGWLVRRRMVGRTYKILEQGTALVLIDGFDDLPPAERPIAIQWMQAFIRQYGNNFIIMAMPTEGYGGLMKVGATPIFLRPWHDQNRYDAIMKLQAQWDSLSKAPIPIDRERYREDEPFFAEIAAEARSLNPLDTLLYYWSKMTGEEQPNESEDMQRYIRYLLPDADNHWLDLQRMAKLQLDEGYIAQRRVVDLMIDDPMTYSENLTPYTTLDEGLVEEEIEEILEEEPTLETYQDPTPDDGRDDLIDEFFGGIGETTTPESVTISGDEAPDSTDVPVGLEEGEEEEESPQRRKLSREAGKVFDKFLKSGLLVAYRGGRYQFRHPIVAAYLGALAIKEATPLKVLEKWSNVNWRYAIRYLAQHRDIDFLVSEQVGDGESIDVLHDPILELAHWVRYAPEEVEWRNHLLRYLGNLMVIPTQYTLTRERIAAALISTRDLGTVVVFRRAMQDNNPHVRQLGALGTGVVRDNGAVNALSNLVLRDADEYVQWSAAFALGALGTEDALGAMVDLLQYADNNIRRIIAETLAMNRHEGYLTLFDAVQAEDMLMRRAAIFGLSRIPTDWSLVQINETFLEDDEFYVRIAAQVALQNLYEASLRGVNAYPSVLEAPWLKEWGQMQIEMGNLPFDATAEDMFVYASTKADDLMIKKLAIQSIAQSGEYQRIEAIYEALRDRKDVIRDQAYRSLGEFQTRLGQPIPAPTG